MLCGTYPFFLYIIPAVSGANTYRLNCLEQSPSWEAKWSSLLKVQHHAKSQPRHPVLTQVDPAPISILILPSHLHLGLCKWSLPLYSHPSNIRRSVQIMKLLSTEIYPTSYHFLPASPKFSAGHPLLRYGLQSWSDRPTSMPHETQSNSVHFKLYICLWGQDST